VYEDFYQTYRIGARSKDEPAPTVAVGSHGFSVHRLPKWSSQGHWEVFGPDFLPLSELDFADRVVHSEGLAPVRGPRQYGLFLADGTEILPVEYEKISRSGELWRVLQDEEVGYCTEAGRWIRNPAQ